MYGSPAHWRQDLFALQFLQGDLPVIPPFLTDDCSGVTRPWSTADWGDYPQWTRFFAFLSDYVSGKFALSVHQRPAIIFERPSNQPRMYQSPAGWKYNLKFCAKRRKFWDLLP